MSELKDKTVIQNKAARLKSDVTRVVVRAKVPAASGDADSVPGEPLHAVTPDSTILGSTDESVKSPEKITAQAGVGSILKQRFELTALLGSGGMGSVYKARDLRQVEAGDSQPWVAVKVINESFARHEHALIALQQETKKTQRLAHPNIVNVYDFDREGDIAFMTMELLDGQPLDAVLSRKPGGLPVQEALEIIRQITQAIEYAHRQGIVHADLKPANIFLSHNGRIKILDFGIAQAMQADSDFDAQSLNALTPAYASVRMLCRERPGTQDDLYALGCIYYLLLTGKHPFNRKRATEADAAGMTPVRLPILNRPQWRALQSLLQFNPVSQTSIQRFQIAFFNEQQQYRRRLAIVAGVVLVVAGVLVAGINGYLNRHNRQLADQLINAVALDAQIAQQSILQLSASDRVMVLDRAREPVADSIEQRLQVLNQAEDYRQLGEYLAVVGNLYSDSSRIQDSMARFATKKTDFSGALATQIEQRLEDRDFSSKPVSFAQQLQALRQVSPDHPLFQRYAVKTLLAKEASVAVYLGQGKKAADILDQAELLFPDEAQKFQLIRTRLVSVAREDSPATDELAAALDSGTRSEIQSEFEQAYVLLQQFELDEHPEAIAGFLQTLGKSDSSLYFVLMQGIRDFLSIQQSNGNGRAYTGLQNAVFGAAPVLAATKPQRRPDPCQLRMANLGKQRGSRCRDTLTAKETGPELVVVKSGQAVFAVTRSEISIHDFNLYCNLYRQCRPQPPSTLPVTEVTADQAQQYARWLSSMSGYRYRLPTLAEWRALALNDSGVQDHNCIVNIAGRIIRGNSLRPVDDGYPNSLGLLNIFGNAEEWVQDGNRVIAVGGAANMDILRCTSGYLPDASGDGSAFRGIRLVRELKS